MTNEIQKCLPEFEAVRLWNKTTIPPKNYLYNTKLDRNCT